MNTNSDPEEERLSQALQQWAVESPLPPRFQEQVWTRIARAQTRPQGSFWAGLIGLVAKSLERPRVAYSYAAVLLAFGIAAGTLTAQAHSSRLENALGQRYVQSIDPYLQAALNP